MPLPRLLVLLSLCVLAWSGCGDASSDGASGTGSLVLGEPAPELDQGLAWLNTPAPIRIADLAGHVVLLDFWTYGCVNCLHVLPDLRQLEEEFAGQPFVVIGVHSGKFETEQDAGSIAQAIRQYDIHHPILVDDDYATMDAYGARAWPTTVLVDVSGQTRARVPGEFEYEAMHDAVTRLLDEAAEEGTLSDDPLVLQTDPNQDAKTPLLFPSDVDAREDGTLVITDSGHHRVIVLSPDDPVPTQIGNGFQGHVDGRHREPPPPAR